MFTRSGCDRVMRYAFELAMTRPKRHVTSATKSNGIIHSMPYWDERFAAMAKQYPDVKTDQYHIDILTRHFCTHPDWFDVSSPRTCSATSCRSLGPRVRRVDRHRSRREYHSGEGIYPSMFEPVHGSAPDIAGKAIATRSPRSGPAA